MTRPDMVGRPWYARAAALSGGGLGVAQDSVGRVWYARAGGKDFLLRDLLLTPSSIVSVNLLQSITDGTLATYGTIDLIDDSDDPISDAAGIWYGGSPSTLYVVTEAGLLYQYSGTSLALGILNVEGVTDLGETAAKIENGYVCLPGTTRKYSISGASYTDTYIYSAAGRLNAGATPSAAHVHGSSFACEAVAYGPAYVPSLDTSGNLWIDGRCNVLSGLTSFKRTTAGTRGGPFYTLSSTTLSRYLYTVTSDFLYATSAFSGGWKFTPPATWDVGVYATYNRVTAKDGYSGETGWVWLDETANSWYYMRYAEDNYLGVADTVEVRRATGTWDRSVAPSGSEVGDPLFTLAIGTRLSDEVKVEDGELTGDKRYMMRTQTAGGARTFIYYYPVRYARSSFASCAVSGYIDLAIITST